MAETVISSYTNFSISLWIKHGNVLSVPLVTFIPYDAINVNKKFIMYCDKDGYVKIIWSKGHDDFTEYTISSTIATNDNLWHHIVFSHDGTSGRLYIDNVLNSTINGTISLLDLVNKYVGGLKTFVQEAVYIPLWYQNLFKNTGGMTRNYSGYMDELRIFNKAIAEKDIKYLYVYRSERYPDFEDFESLLYWYEEVGFESFFELPKDVGNDLNTMAAFIKLGDARGTLDIDNAGRAKENNLYPLTNNLPYLIQKITVANASNNSEIWILNPFKSKRYGFNKSGNYVEIAYTSDRTKQGKYNIVSWREVGLYLVLEVSKISGLDQVISGGYIYINRDIWKLSEPRYPLYFDKDFIAYTHT